MVAALERAEARAEAAEAHQRRNFIVAVIGVGVGAVGSIAAVIANFPG